MHRFFSTSFLVLTVTLVFGAVTAFAATITVRKDGTGDYTQVQPALDAAASGDTVLIGPGEFTELTPSYIPGYAWDVEVCAYVRVPNLTIIGAGAGQTVLGPTSYLGSTQTFSPKAMVWLEGSERNISGITFRNCYDGIHATNGPIFVEDCEFDGNGGYGIIWHPSSPGGRIRNCTFRSTVFGNFGLGMGGGGLDVEVENCIFDGCEISIKTIQNIAFIDCEMKNSRAGIQLSAGARVVIDNCQIHDCSITGILLSGVGPHCDLINSVVSGDQAAVASYAEATLTATGTIFEGGSDSVFYIQNAGSAEVHDCHLFRNGTYTINCNQPEGLGLVVHDFTGNYWGSIDPAVVASWIKDQNDDPTNFSIVNFLPLADGPVPVESKSWGDVKAFYR